MSAADLPVSAPFPGVAASVVDAYYQATADQVAEIVDGELSLRPRPRPRHAKVATRLAGAPPFKARDLAESAKRFSSHDLRRAFRVLAETDQALKGSKRDPEHLLEASVLALMR